MSTPTTFHVWNQLPGEIKNHIIEYLPTMDLLRFAQTSKDSVARISYLMTTDRIQRIECNTLCVKSGNTDVIYLECVQHEGRHENNDLKWNHCNVCLDECVHYREQFGQHQRMFPRCRAIFTKAHVLTLPKILNLIDVKDTTSFAIIKPTIKPSRKQNCPSTPWTPNNKYVRDVMKKFYNHDFSKNNWIDTQFFYERHYNSIEFNQQYGCNVRYEKALCITSSIRVKSKIFTKYEELEKPVLINERPKISDEEVTLAQNLQHSFEFLDY